MIKTNKMMIVHKRLSIENMTFKYLTNQKHLKMFAGKTSSIN